MFANKVLLEHGCAHPFPSPPGPPSHDFSRRDTAHPAHKEENLSCPVLEGTGGNAAVQPLSKTTNAGAYPLHEQVHFQWVRGRPGALPPRDPQSTPPEEMQDRDTTRAHPCFWSRLLMTLGGGATGRRANHRQRQDPARTSLLAVSQGIPSSKGHPKPSYKCPDSGRACPQCAAPQGNTLESLGSMASVVSTSWSVKANPTIR